MTSHELSVMKYLLADLEGAVEMVGDECPRCWYLSIADAKEILDRENQQ